MKTRTFTRILCLCFIGQLATVAAAKTVTTQWALTDLAFETKEVPEAPFETNVTAKLTAPGGKASQLPLFYNGNREYVLRASLPEQGEWSFELDSALGDLDGRSGVIEVKAAAEGQHGPIAVHPKHPRRFAHADGTPYYPIAFECDWLFALDADNPDDIPLTRKFVDSLAEYGFNQVVMNVFAYDVKWTKDPSIAPEHEFGSPESFPFGGSNDKPDHTQLNVEYFKRLDRVIDYLDQKGIAAHLMIYVWNKRVNWPPAGSEADNRYFDYVVKRYQAYPNLVWDISKEALGYGHNDVHYITERIDRLRRLDTFERLVTVHAYNYCKRFPDKLDFISVQLWRSELYSVMRNVVEDFPGKPIMNIEHGGYEAGPYEVFNGNFTSAEACLERAYQCVFAGTYPTHYWQGAAWNVIVPDIAKLEESARPRLDYYRHMRTLVEKYDIGSLKAGERRSNGGFCLDNGKNLFIYYVPKENDYLGVRLPKDKMGKKMTETWFDPFTGKFSEPVEKKFTKWLALPIPASGTFSILIVETSD